MRTLAVERFTFSFVYRTWLCAAQVCLHIFLVFVIFCIVSLLRFYTPKRDLPFVYHSIYIKFCFIFNFLTPFDRQNMLNHNVQMGLTSLMIALSVVLDVDGSALHKESTLSRRQGAITQAHTGQGTMWGGNWKGGKYVPAITESMSAWLIDAHQLSTVNFSCLFAYWDQPTQYPEIAMGGDNWNDGLLCGACIEVQSGSNPPVIGLVGDKCPSCTREGIDLDPEMWRRVTRGAKAGKITVTWYVKAPPPPSKKKREL